MLIHCEICVTGMRLILLDFDDFLDVFRNSFDEFPCLHVEDSNYLVFQQYS